MVFPVVSTDSSPVGGMLSLKQSGATAKRGPPSQTILHILICGGLF